MNYLEIVQSFRDRIEQQENSAIQEVNRRYIVAIESAIVNFKTVLATAVEFQKRNHTVSKQFIYSSSRFVVTVSQLIDEIETANKFTVDTITSYQQAVVRQSFEDAQTLIREAAGIIPSGVDFDKAFLKFDGEAAKQIISRLSQEGPLTQILAANTVDVMKASQVFLDAIIQGQSIKDPIKILTTQLGMSLVRAQTTVHTEIMSSYRDGNLARYKVSPVVKGWEWSATLDDRTCPVCIFMDGQRFTLDEPFATHPNCRCSPLPITFTWRELGIDANEYLPETGPRGQEWFDQQSGAVQKIILKEEKYDLYRAGKITLKDLTEYFVHPKYGPSREERSILEMKRQGILN